MTVFSPLDPGSELERMERRIRGVEAQALAAIEVGDESYDAQFRELDQDAHIEAELAALKAGSVATPELAAGATSSTSTNPTADGS